jgi:hypothetical protein
LASLLVTGGAGFIGGNFVHYWNARHPDDSVIVLDALMQLASLECRSLAKPCRHRPSRSREAGHRRPKPSVNSGRKCSNSTIVVSVSSPTFTVKAATMFLQVFMPREKLIITARTRALRAHGRRPEQEGQECQEKSHYRP